jgi:uncharacterized protein YbbC (DUF1343 family)
MKNLFSLCIALIFSAMLFGQEIKTGAESVNEYLPLLKGKKVAVLSNQTGIIGKTHLVDS